ncbi:hypothetical protein C8245_21205 [Paracidovorax avenae]|uniref:Arc family DNA-binding protein n=1 Tax=Paracidovorax avenae TaxID=80867 RepID=UPI000D1FFD45|nr:Arc family DNA-binding protein [Paracidovorax avenae]AVS68918.1 hypothetical protein C8245_21205 [Paracidovorax avenae]
MSKELPPSRTAEQFVVRFPDGMRDEIAAAAKKNNRSMNAEIVARLQDSFIRTHSSHLAPPSEPYVRAVMESGIVYAPRISDLLAEQNAKLRELLERVEAMNQVAAPGAPTEAAAGLQADPKFVDAEKRRVRRPPRPVEK